MEDFYLLGFDKMKSIIIVGAGIMQIPAIKTAKKMGLKVIATDMNPLAEGFQYADVPVVLNTKDVEGHIKFVIENHKKYNVAGAFSGADVAITVAGITNALNLPGISVDVAIRSNNKSLMKKRWLEDGIPTPFAKEINNKEEAIEALDELNGFPVMIKPVDSAASRGCKKIENMNELDEAISEAKEKSSTKTALVEEFVVGDEQSVETIVYDGIHYHCGIADRHFGFDPYSIEIGHTNPTKLSNHTQNEIYGVVDRAAKSLGIKFGPAKADMILTENGPKILEMPARLSGGFHSQYTTPLSTGMNPIRAVLNLAIGNQIPIDDVTPKLNKVSICKAIFPNPGRIVKISGIEKAKRIKGVAQIIMVAKEGDVITEYKNCAQRICYIITVGDTHEEANKIFESASRTISVETK